MPDDNPESMVLAVLKACADCDICRFLMEGTPCLVFPELYRLYDKETESRGSITAGELRSLVDLCSFCALCPCPDVRSDLMKAKSAFIERDGLKPAIRFLEDVERIATVCGAYPMLTNALLRNGLTGRALKRVGGIHAERQFPPFPKEGFPAWAREQGLHIRREGKRRKIAYFAGCTGQYFFPDVPRAVVEILQHNGVEVYYPEQKCCGMPSMLEGDRGLTLDLAGFNLRQLSDAVTAGYDIVCSCPTCGYMLKRVLSEGAAHGVLSQQGSSSGESDSGASPKTSISRESDPPPAGTGVFDGLFKDEGYFASLDPGMRMVVATHTYDLGEYLVALYRSGELNTEFGSLKARMAYYPPCHLREQKIGSPWAELLTLIPGISIETIEGSFFCCGMAGIMGFKEAFHKVSIKVGRPLMEKIEAIHPEKLLTDCLSCRLQFIHMISQPVLHPIEILKEAYAGNRK